jgi:hypothetical protein
MRTGRRAQVLTFNVPLPDETRTDALRQTVKQTEAIRWPHLDACGKHMIGPACKHVGQEIASGAAHTENAQKRAS